MEARQSLLKPLAYFRGWVSSLLFLDLIYTSSVYSISTINIWQIYSHLFLMYSRAWYMHMHLHALMCAGV